ncbi:hypothetical protein BO82DRAFT_13664 [Aspergillus uvarum CBS 121591]|uniref:Uncharacterized protein n=1 Tax=Aspergillus uvarum CBS 121591 TaxID=1448315 RepID=A0A319BTA8_9EURO|nr:hypothetical protein BO82DRAFT_13664 [Aspergillus uvarum CBS 121591]PYH75784.1 hypothetical protein BO82DRAFT_13664 [Aspergillus uvarum CBS 121591]
MTFLYERPDSEPSMFVSSQSHSTTRSLSYVFPHRRLATILLNVFVVCIFPKKVPGSRDLFQILGKVTYTGKRTRMLGTKHLL